MDASIEESSKSSNEQVQKAFTNAPNEVNPWALEDFGVVRQYRAQIGEERHQDVASSNFAWLTCPLQVFFDDSLGFCGDFDCGHGWRGGRRTSTAKAET